MIEMPGDLGLPTLSPLYVNGMPLENLVDALAANSDQVEWLRENHDQQFWSTPPRENADRTREVVEISLNSAQRINIVSMSLAHFPHRAWIQYLDPADSRWRTFTQQSGLPARITIGDSVPLVIPPAMGSSSKLHPQHFGAGHWVSYRIKVNPVVTARVRVVLARIPSPSPPINTLKQRIAYPLGVKDLSVGYEVASQADVPVVNRSGDVATESSVIATSTDILGSPVNYLIRQNRASDLLAGRGIWKSGPQPIATAVVNLYVDARDAQGNPQVVEKFYLEPLHTGSTMNIYYSLDDPEPASFPAQPTPLAFPATRPVGAVLPDSSDTGILFPSSPCFLDIDNRAVQFDPRRPFQLGMQLYPQFDSSVTDPVTVYDDGVLRIFYGPDPSGTVPSGVFQVSLGNTLLSWPGLQFSFNQRLRFVLQWDGRNLKLFTPLEMTGIDDGSGGDSFQNVVAVTGDVPTDTRRPSNLRIGGSLTTDPEDSQPANAKLRSLYIKSGNPDDLDRFLDYWTDPTAFVVTPEYPSAPRTTDNMILRYDPAQRTQGADSLNPYGLLGGPGVAYESMNWIPVRRDFLLKKGFCEFDPTSARFFKLEFSNLIAEPFETDRPVVLTAKIFARNRTGTASVVRASAQSSNTGGSGLQVNAEKAATNRFDDQNRLTTSGSQAVNTQADSTTPYLPTEAQYVTDPQAAALMAQSAPYWNFSPHSPQATMPQQEKAGTHYYETVSVETNGRVAFFVGLSKITMYRQNWRVADDTDQYLELFHDDTDLLYEEGIQGWSLQGGQLSTPSDLISPISTISQPINSFRAIRGLQFATTQTPPRQLLKNSDFDDTSLRYWQPLGDAGISVDPYFSSAAGSFVRVTRAGAEMTWDTFEQYGTWDDIEDSDLSPNRPTWDSLQATVGASSNGGIQSSQEIDVSPIGKLYAAARIIAPKDLSAPVVLQLVNGDGTILSQEPVMASANQIVEWSTEYNIGSGGEVSAVTWDDVADGSNTWDQTEAIGTWTDVAQTVAERVVHGVTVRLLQEQPTSDVWYVDNIALFEDPIVWEFSRDGGQTFWQVWDVRNDPHGAFVFPDGDHQSPTGGSSLVWRVTGGTPGLSVSALQIRPWFDSVMMGMPFKRIVQKGGLNLNPLDHSPDVSDDPMFRVWHRPIPQDWFYVYRQWLRQNAVQPVPRPSTGPSTGPGFSVMPLTFVRGS